MANLTSLPAQAVLSDLFAAQPRLTKLLMPLAQEILRGPSPLTHEQREFLFAFGSGLNACHYCQGSHTAAAAALGADAAAIDAALDDIDSAPVEDSFKALLRYLKKLTENPSRVASSDADAVRAAGWSDQALHDAIAVCALHNFFNRWVDGTGVDASDDYLRDRGVFLAQWGYTLKNAAPETEAA